VVTVSDCEGVVPPVIELKVIGLGEATRLNAGEVTLNVTGSVTGELEAAVYANTDPL
jgi:hypothetical protein